MTSFVGLDVHKITFSNGHPAEEITDKHSTAFRARDESDFRPTFKQRLRHLTSDLLPPIVVRQLRKIRPER